MVSNQKILKSIPSDWSIKSFGEIFHTVTDYVANGSFASLRENVQYKDTEDYAILIRLQDFSNKFKGDFVYVDEHAFNFLSKSSLEPGNIVISNVGAVGTVFRVPDLKKPMTLGPNAILVKSHYDETFLFYWLQSEYGQKSLLSITTTTAQPKFNKTDFKSILCPLPPLSEQRKIAAILSSVDEAIEKTEAIIEQTEKVKKGLMQQLLTKGIGHTKFKKTEIGEIPEEWEIVQLQNVTNQITDGTHKTPTYTENGIPFLRVTDIQSEEIDFTKIKYISEREHKELIKRCKPEKGDVLLSKNGTIGLVKVINWDWEFSIFVSLCLIKVQKDKLLPEFLAYFLQSDIALKQFRLRSKQGTVTNLHLIEIRELLCGLPSIEEQYKIVQILNSISKKISKETKKLEILMTIKKGLMQVLLTGKVRVKVEDEVMSQ